jgi:hypothetical protein
MDRKRASYFAYLFRNKDKFLQSKPKKQVAEGDVM